MTSDQDSTRDRAPLGIRDEAPGDRAAIDDVITRAFAELAFSRHDEQAIVRALRAEGALTVSLVGELDGRVVGHVAISPVSIADGSEGWFGLGPVAVEPERQGVGIGGAMIETALDRLRAAGASGCVVLGDPGYYGRFGFRADPTLTLDGVPAEAFQCLRLAERGAVGAVTYHAAFGVGE